jgi:hypothetical protein
MVLPFAARTPRGDSLVPWIVEKLWQLGRPVQYSMAQKGVKRGRLRIMPVMFVSDLTVP